MMRELSEREKDFLAKSLPSEAPASSGGKLRSSYSPVAKFSRIFSTTLRWLPLGIGLLTLLLAALGGYLYLWGRDFFKVETIGSLESDGTLGFIDETTSSWFTGIADIFEMAPWIILAALILGIVLMAVSMVLIGKRRNG